jgi:TonB family protein
MRRFQYADKKLVLMMSQRLESDELRVGYIDEGDRHDLYAAGKASIAIGEMKPVETRAVHVPSRLLAGVEILAEVPSDLNRTMSSASTFGLSERDRAALFSAVDFGAVQSALGECRKSRLAGFGVDPEDFGRFVTPPKAIAGKESTISQSDYPADARKTRQAGIVSILYSMEPSGTIGRCIVTGSSGVPSLDAATCDSLVKRTLFRPALDENGKPVRVWSSRSVHWTPPLD